MFGHLTQIFPQGLQALFDFASHGVATQCLGISGKDGGEGTLYAPRVFSDILKKKNPAWGNAASKQGGATGSGDRISPPGIFGTAILLSTLALPGGVSRAWLSRQRPPTNPADVEKISSPIIFFGFEY